MNNLSRKQKNLEQTRSRIACLNDIAIKNGWTCWSAYETAVLNKKCAPTKCPANLRQRARPKSKKISVVSR